MFAAILRQLRKKPAERAHRPVYDAIVAAALAGEVDAAAKLIDALVALPPAKSGAPTALTAQAIDVLSHVAGLGDRFPMLTALRRERMGIAAIERLVRERLSMNAYAGSVPGDDSWQTREPPWFAIDRWRRIQQLVHPSTATEASERDALERLAGVIADWGPESRGAGYGAELVIAFDLAFRYGQRERATAWAEAHHTKVALKAEEMLCLPAIAREMVGGFFARWFPAGDELTAIVELAAELAASGPSKPPTKLPRIQRLEVYCDYSQIHLEPFEPTDAERAQEIQWTDTDFERGMCLFPTKVAIATPGETSSLRATIEVTDTGPLDLDELLSEAVQAMTFPLEVRGPLALRSCTDLPDTAEPIYVAAGSYDVLARFSNEISRASSLRSFDLWLTFHPAGALGAPRTIRLE